MGRRGIFVRDAADRITSDSQTRRGGKGGFYIHGSPLSEKRMQAFFFWHRTGPSSYWQLSDFVPHGLLRAIYSCRYVQLVQMGAIHQGYQPSSPSHYNSQGREGVAPLPLCTVGSQGVDLRLFTISLWWDSNPWQVILQLNLTLSAASVKSWLGTGGWPWMQQCALILCIETDVMTLFVKEVPVSVKGMRWGWRSL